MREQIARIRVDRTVGVEQCVDQVRILRQERSFAEESVPCRKDRKSDRDRAITEIRLLIRELKALLTVADTEIERKDLAAASKVVRRVFETEERTADARDTAVHRDLLTAFLLDLDDQVNVRIRFVSSRFDILVLIDRIEVLRLVDAHQREFEEILVIYVAFV